MGISRYLAMTASEMEAFSPPDDWSVAYMACHFSPYGTGLSNIPAALPVNSMLILNDRMPPCGHDPNRIAQQLLEAAETLCVDSVLLDFERPDLPLQQLCETLPDVLPCPVGVSSLYAHEFSCPVFLPPMPFDQPLEEYLSPWQGREIWLDIAPDNALFTVTESGSHLSHPIFTPPEDCYFEEPALHCLYRTEITEDLVRFHLWRPFSLLESLMSEASHLGITKYIGLYQQLCFP